MEPCASKKKTKRSFHFQQAWLSDERFKSWLRKVASDDSLFYCIVCNKNFSCSSVSHLIRHAESAHHKRNIEEPILFDNKNDNVASKPQLKRKFRHQWLDNEQFKPWLRETPEINSFSCIICNKILTGGLSHIYQHADSETHKNNLEKCDIKMKTPNLLIDESLSFDEQKQAAEIRFAALIADKGIPLDTAKTILNFFQDVGKNPNVLKSMSLARTKCKNIITNVLYPAEINRLQEHIQNTKFSIYIDETSDISNQKWMTFHVRYVDHETLQVHSQLVKLIDIDATDCSAEKLFQAFKYEMWKLEIPFSNIIALSCDNASVMIGKHSSFKKKLEEMCKNVLTIACPCHSAALVAHAACAKIPQVCEEFVRKIANFINSSPKRTAIFREFLDCFEENTYKILKLSDTRWLSRHACIDRLLKSWDTIKLFLREMVISEKTKSGESLLCVMEDVETKAYLLFLKYILNSFNKFNCFFQAMETRIHLLQQKSQDFLMEICTHFIKPDVLAERSLSSIIFSNIENHKCLTDIDLGSECEEYLDEFVKNGYIDMVATIRKNCLQFYITAAEEIYKRLPVNNFFLSKLTVFQSHNALFNSNRETSFNDVSFIARTIGGFDESDLKNEWFTLNLDFTLSEKQNLRELNFDNMWMQILQNKDSINKIKYPNLKSLLNSIRSLPHSNADPERIFSLLTDIKTKKRNKLSSTVVNAMCVLKSALKSRGETILDMKMNENHFSRMSSDKLYANFPKRQKKDNFHVYPADEDDEADDPSPQ